MRACNICPEVKRRFQIYLVIKTDASHPTFRARLERARIDLSGSWTSSVAFFIHFFYLLGCQFAEKRMSSRHCRLYLLLVTTRIRDYCCEDIEGWKGRWMGYELGWPRVYRGSGESQRWWRACIGPGCTRGYYHCPKTRNGAGRCLGSEAPRRQCPG